jgi:bifunctional non-homologous end joining protein LigD
MRPQPPLAGIEPMLAEAATAVPAGAGWLHEKKYDGVRALARITATSVALTTRRGHNKAKQFPEVVQSLIALRHLFGQDLLLDGEIVDQASDGYRGLQRLQRRLPMEKPFEIGLLAERSPAAFAVFDVLVVAATTLNDHPLAERRMVLRTLLAEPVPGLRLSEQGEDGAAMLARARAEDWEGLVSKRADSRYYAGQRTSVWRKIKLVRRQEFVVGGFTISDSPQRPFRALLVGYHDDQGGLVYAGRVGTGFSDREMSDLSRRVHSIVRANTPFSVPPVLGDRITWVEPRLVVETRFKDWSVSGHLTDPTFLSIRSDKAASAVVRGM